MNVRKLINSIALLCVTAVLASCALDSAGSSEFGMSRAQFNKLSPQERQRVIKRYNREQAQEQQNQEVWNALGEAASLIHGRKTLSSSHSEHCTTSANGMSRSCSGSSSNFSVGFN